MLSMPARRLPGGGEHAERDGAEVERLLDAGQEHEEAVGVHVLEAVTRDDRAGHALGLGGNDLIGGA